MHITRDNQQADVIYVRTDGREVFFTPDGEGRIWFDSLDEAIDETGLTWVCEFDSHDD